MALKIYIFCFSDPLPYSEEFVLFITDWSLQRLKNTLMGEKNSLVTGYESARRNPGCQVHLYSS